MNFNLTKEQELIKNTVREFAETKIEPMAFQLDEKSIFPEKIIKEMGELNIMGIPYPKEYGGAGMDILTYAIAVEELSRVDAGVGVALSAHVSLGSWPIMEFGTEDQKKKYLTPLASGNKIGAFGLTEENAGSDASNTETTAVLNGDHYILNGAKIFITNGGYAEIYVIFAVTTPGIGTKGISAFIVEKDSEGFTFGTHYNKMGIRSSATAELLFRDVKVPAENLLGKEGQGFKIAMMTLEGGRIGIAAQALGIAQGAYEKALNYSKERVQFGKPICEQQVIAFKLADMATKIRAARFMVYSAAELKQEHKSYGTESAMAKLYASDVCLEVVNDAVQIYGGYGYIKGFAVERMYRDAKICTIYEGTNEIHKLIISHSILHNSKKAPAVSAINSATNVAEIKPVTKVLTENRKGIIIKEGSTEEKIATLINHLKIENIKSQGNSIIHPGGNISDADKVCSIGRGLVAKEDLPIIEALAGVMGAEVGCSRPIAEENEWMPLDRYVGISGQKFKGSLYLAIGISGQVQHVRGIRDAKIIVAINSDERAPIFSHADYGIVGDLYEIVPRLTEILKKY
ncbi:acyl-CoA dehydrogenase family protein [Clostridium estertheticum]|uniref:acyl-CoA dehydrogenase family protein n=1 Tax=Clostridium estertheticum TaxID=238834 RepID=UPI0013E8FE1F|nr:acyl-CoA dehydrogenase family protein [Clostridium estertheticum]MBZ9688547.1 acyl-CoA dehydrogenase family protein [Clostridium estertheticum]